MVIKALLGATRAQSLSIGRLALSLRPLRKEARHAPDHP